MSDETIGREFSDKKGRNDGEDRQEEAQGEEDLLERKTLPSELSRVKHRKLATPQASPSERGYA